MQRASLLAILLALASAPAAAQSGYEEPVASAPFAVSDAAPCLAALGNESDATCAVLYSHIFFVYPGSFAMNLQSPYDTRLCHDPAEGFWTFPSAGVLPMSQPSLWFWPTPGPVAYVDDQKNEICSGAHVWMSGINADVDLEPLAPIYYTWFLSADMEQLGWASPSPEIGGGALPCVTVHVELRTGPRGSAHAREPSGGDLLASGDASRTIITSTERRSLDGRDPCARGDAVEARFPDLEVSPVHEFPVVLTPAARSIHHNESFHVVIQWWQWTLDGTPPLTHPGWSVHAGPELRPRLVLPLTNAFEAADSSATVENGTLVATVSVRSPWGPYDVSSEGATLQLQTANGSAIGEPVRPEFLTYSGPSHSELPDYPPTRLHFRTPLPAGLQGGTYRAHMEVPNLQGLEVAIADALVELPSTTSDSDAILPGPGIILILAATMVAVAIRRRPG